MREYTLLAVFSLLITIFLDRLTKVRILRNKIFYFFIVVILVFKFLVNGYLTSTKIVMYNPKFFMGLRAGSIPFEDFIFGFSMVTISIIFWEFFKKRNL